MPEFNYGEELEILSSTCCVDRDFIINYPFNCQGQRLCCSPEHIDNEICIAIERVETLTRQWWCPRELCFRFSGSGDTKQFFIPLVDKPLMEVTTVRLYSCSSGCGCPTTGTNSYVEVSDYNRYDYYVTRGCGKCWPCGDDNVEVCGTWGKVMPDAIKKAVAIMVWEALLPGSTGLNQVQGVSRVDWDDFSISYAVDSKNPEILGTGIRYVDNILADYINNAGIVFAIPGNTNCRTSCTEKNR